MSFIIFSGKGKRGIEVPSGSLKDMTDIGAEKENFR